MIKFLSLFIIFISLSATRIPAQSAIASGRNIEEKDFYLMLGYPLAIPSNEFFDIYRNALEGNKSLFDQQLNFGAGTRFEIMDNFRLAMAGNFFLAQLSESYTQGVEFPRPGNRQIVQDIKIQTIPLILSIEHVPWDAQFRTYVGGGGGICFGTIEWNESVYSDIPRDTRTGGLQYEGNEVFPAIRAYIGVELGFDKRRVEALPGSLIIELRYTYIFRKIDIFYRIRRQFQRVPPELESPVTLMPSVLELDLAVSLNFITKISNRSKQ